MEQPRLYDRYIRLVGIPLIGLLVPYLLHPNEFLVFGRVFWQSLFLSFTSVLLLWEGDRQIFLVTRRRYPLFSQTTRRLVVQALAVVAYTLMISVAVNYWLCGKLLHFHEGDDLLADFRINLIPTIIVMLCYESVYFFQSWKENVQKAEKLARISLESQLAVLKSQLDPHFLFNSLNTLAAMLDENEPASAYLEQLADVYRYVLINREKNLVSLDEEMRFLDAYIYLNKTRFRENLQVEKQLIPAALGRRIAPLSLQLLVENAIKHNVVSKEHPLIIKIQEEGADYLVVANNVQAKTILRNAGQDESTRIGLQNLRERYRLLTNQSIEITSDATQFRVRIPLIIV